MNKKLQNFFLAALILFVGIFQGPLAFANHSRTLPNEVAEPISYWSHPNGLEYNSFNRFSGNPILCKYMGWISSDGSCSNPSYMDERDFVGVNPLYRLNADDKYEFFKDEKFYHNITAENYTPQDQDILRVLMYVHNSADNIADEQHTAKKTKVYLDIVDHVLYGQIVAENAYFNDSEYKGEAVSNHVASFVDIAGITLPDEYELKIWQPDPRLNDASTVHFRQEMNSDGSTKTLKTATDRSRYLWNDKQFLFDQGDMQGCYPHAFVITVDLIVEKKEEPTTYCGDGIVQQPNSAGIFEQCDDGNTVNDDGCDNLCKTVTPPPTTYCGDGIVQTPNSAGFNEQCDDGNTNNNDSCDNLCRTVTPPPPPPPPASNYCGDGIAQWPNDNNQYEECDDGNSDNNDACSNLCTINEFQCEGGCACIEVTAEPKFVGDFQETEFTVEVSNRNQFTHTGYVELINAHKRNGSTQFAKIKYLNNDRNQGGPYDPTMTNTNEGDLEILGATLVRTEAGYTRRNNASLNSRFPIQVEGLNNYRGINPPPVVIRNLLPADPNLSGDRKGDDGDKVIIKVRARARTSKPGHEFTAGTGFIDYNYFMRTQSNNAYDSVIISRPFFMTYNAGDVITSAVITSIANINSLLKQSPGYRGQTINEVSGFVFSASQALQELEGSEQFTDTNINPEQLQENVEKNLPLVVGGEPTVKGVSRSIVSENQINSTLFGTRPDGVRVFTFDGDLAIDSVGAFQVSDRTTIVIRNGNLIINSDIEYTGANAAIAFVVQDGDVLVHPRVKNIDGVYVVLSSSPKGIKGTSNWKQYYEGGAQPERLIVNGSLIGNIDGLIESRPYVTDPTKEEAAVSVNFDGRVLSSPPPGLRELLGGTFEKLKQ